MDEDTGRFRTVHNIHNDNRIGNTDLRWYYEVPIATALIVYISLLQCKCRCRITGGAGKVQSQITDPALYRTKSNEYIKTRLRKSVNEMNDPG